MLDKERVRAGVKISTYLHDVGIKVSRGRAVAKWRGGKNPNVAVDDIRGTWRDFKTNEGGDIFALFKAVEGGDFASALRTLASRYAISGDAEQTNVRRPSRSCRAAEPPAEPLTQAERDFVPVTLLDYHGTQTAATVAAEVRQSDADDADCRRQAARQLRLMFRAGEKIWAGWIVDGEETMARFGMRQPKTNVPLVGRDIFCRARRAGVIEAHMLADRIERRVCEIPTHVSLNPVSGARSDGGSFDDSATVADYRHVLVEFDGLFDTDAKGIKTPSSDHLRVIDGLLDYAADNPSKMRVIFAVYSGGKSVHVCLRVRADGVESYRRQTNALRDIFASADDPKFRSDTPGWENGYSHIRLAGALRLETGRRARLLTQPESKAVPAEPTATATEPTEPHTEDRQQPEPQVTTPEAPPEAPTANGGYRWRCDSCGCAARCREAWGRYWPEKSHGGRGCDAPVKAG